MSNYVLSPQAVRKLKTALQGKRGTGGAHMNGPANVYESEYPAPFAVQWAQSVGDSGNWIIWLPGASLVMLGGTPLDVREDLDAAGSGYPSGWYTLEDILSAAGGTLYLLITIPQEEGEESGSSSSSSSSSASASETEEPKAELSGSAGTAPTITIPVCVAATATGTGRKSVKQFLASAVVIASGGSPAVTIPGPFQPVHDATTGLLTGFTNCIYCAERQFVECGTGGAMSISGVTEYTSGYVVLTLPHAAYASSTASGATVIDNDNVSIAIENALPMNAYATETKIPLYHVTAGVVDVDLRAVPTGVLAR